MGPGLHFTGGMGPQPGGIIGTQPTGGHADGWQPRRLETAPPISLKGRVTTETSAERGLNPTPVVGPHTGGEHGGGHMGAAIIGLGAAIIGATIGAGAPGGGHPAGPHTGTLSGTAVGAGKPWAANSGTAKTAKMAERQDKRQTVRRTMILHSWIKLNEI